MPESARELTATAAAQLPEPTYEPVTLMVAAAKPIVPENTAVTAPLGVGQPSAETSVGRVTEGKAARVAPGVVGN